MISITSGDYLEICVSQRSTHPHISAFPKQFEVYTDIPGIVSILPWIFDFFSPHCRSAGSILSISKLKPTFFNLYNTAADHPHEHISAALHLCHPVSAESLVNHRCLANCCRRMWKDLKRRLSKLSTTPRRSLRTSLWEVISSSEGRLSFPQKRCGSTVWGGLLGQTSWAQSAQTQSSEKSSLMQAGIKFLSFWPLSQTEKNLQTSSLLNATFRQCLLFILANGKMKTCAPQLTVRVRNAETWFILFTRTCKESPS